MRAALVNDARRALLTGLIDDAAQFPPARLPLAAALEGYREHREGPDGWLQGRFLCPSTRLDDLPADSQAGLPAPEGVAGLPAPEGGAGLPAPEGAGWVGVVVPPEQAGADALAAVLAARDPRVASVEVALPADPAGWDDHLAALQVPTTVARVYLEVPLGDPAGAVARLAGARGRGEQAGIAAKVRCGGVTAGAVPPVEAVAAFLVACVAHQLPFKATAGLHHPVRHLDRADGWVQHGFLNVLGGAVLHAAGAVSAADLRALVAETDPTAFTLTAQAFAWRDAAADGAAVTAGRALAHGYGSCSFSEPTDALRALGLL